MALHINIEDLLNKRKVESDRIEFKAGWNPVDIYHSICAFANDIDNLGGGYILVGVAEENGVAKRPVQGIAIEKLDAIQRDMQRYNQLFSPYYAAKISVEEVDGKYVFAIWAKAGIDRPYRIPSDVNAKLKKPVYYVRYGTSSVEAKGEMLEELLDLAMREPFDERPNPKIHVEDISLLLLRDHLVNVNSRLADELLKRPIEDVLDQMELYAGPTENKLLRNVAAMMFCEDPCKFFPYAQVDVVNFPEGKVKNPHNFTEETFKGSVPQMIKNVMSYFRTNVLHETVLKRRHNEESIRYWNYPYQAIEEAVVNALYHRDYQQHEPVEITVEPHNITILNCPGPDRSIRIEDLKKGEILKARRYRNRRLGDFLKELDLTEGRSTGVPTIQNDLARNGSPRASFETDDDRLCFIVNIPAHEELRQEDIPLQLNLPQDISKEVYQDNTLENILLQKMSQDVSQDMSHDEKNAVFCLKETENLRLIIILLFMALEPVKMEKLMHEAKETNRSRFAKRYIKPLLHLGWLQRTFPNKPTSKNQAYLTSPAIAAIIKGKL